MSYDNYLLGIINSQIEDSVKTFNSLDATKIHLISEVIAKCFKNGGKMLLCGNGGSAADCQHFAAELVVRFRSNVNRPSLPAIALTCDTSTLTAGGNDLGFDSIFAQQVAGLGQANDILVGISTSGNSQNVINAINTAKDKSMITIGLLGCDGGKIKDICDYPVIVNHKTTARIQESHLLIYHI